MDPEFRPLWDVAFDDPGRDGSSIDLVLALADRIRAAYRGCITDPAVSARNPSDTLISKVLLGAIGCVPAVDRYFIVGYRHVGLPYTRFDRAFLRGAFEFYRRNASEFGRAQTALGSSYPPMKLLDMYFWEVGFALETTDESSQA